MRGGIVATVCALGVLTLAGGSPGKPLDKELRQGGWYSEYGPAREAARRAGKPLFVVFRCEP
jgi:hypothetical protein